MKIDFEFTTPHGVFRDALHLDDNHTLSTEEIVALQQERLENWLAMVENPPEPETEVVEIGGVLYEKVEIDGQSLLKPVEG